MSAEVLASAHLVMDEFSSMSRDRSRNGSSLLVTYAAQVAQGRPLSVACDAIAALRVTQCDAVARQGRDRMLQLVCCVLYVAHCMHIHVAAAPMSNATCRLTHRFACEALRLARQQPLEDILHERARRLCRAARLCSAPTAEGSCVPIGTYECAY